MFDIFVMFFFFLGVVIIHLLVCRKKSQEGLLLRPFITIALMNLFLLWGFFWFSNRYMHSDPTSIWSVRLYGCAVVIYILLIPTYLVFYFSTQQMSPSKKILLLLSAKGPLSFQELLKDFSDEEFVLPRLKELIGIRCLVEHGGWYVLTPTGAQMANVYKIYQFVLGRAKGG